MKLNLATYTAEHGLEWHYDKSALGFAELDRCRHLLGALPDFNAGESGYVGVAAAGKRVFAIRCAKAKAWDFKGRDALYMTVTWMPRTDALNVDFQVLLKSRGMCEQTHEYKFSFEAECRWNGEDKNKPDWQTHIENGDDVFVRQDLDGSNPTIRIVEKKGDDNMTEAEKVLFEKSEVVEPKNTSGDLAEKQPVKTVKAKEENSVPYRVVGVVVFIALILLGTYLARMTDQVLAGYIVGAAAFAVLGAVWKVKK